MTRKAVSFLSFLICLALFSNMGTLLAATKPASGDINKRLAEKKQLAKVIPELKSQQPGKNFLADEVLVAAASRPEADRIAADFGASVHQFLQQGLAVLTLPADQSVVAAVELSVSETNDLPVVYPNYIYQTAEAGADAVTETVSADLSAVSSDPSVNEQYFHNSIHDFEAWDFTKGAADTVVAIIDTGIDLDHPEFAGKISDLSYNASSGNVGSAFVNDDQGHGTHVAGIIAADEENGLGGCGIAPDVSLLVIKSNKPSYPTLFDLSTLITAIYYAADHGADVINMSLGRTYNDGPSSVEQAAIQYAVSKGALVVCAAGNNSSSHAGYPAAYPEAVAVSALQSSDAFDSSYSNHGPEIDLAAPGTAILSTYPDKSYKVLSGTSMACPVVAGTAALIKSAFPALTVDQLRAKLYAAANDRGTAGWDEYYGHGIVNAYDAVVPDTYHKVCFNSQGGNLVDRAVVAPDALLTPPVPPVWWQHRFAGWYQEPECLSPWDFAQTTVPADITLYAKWENTPWYVVSTTSDFASVQINRSIQMVANLVPESASSSGLSWQVINGTGTAAISAAGVLTGLSAGMVTVRAFDPADPVIYGEKVIQVFQYFAGYGLPGDPYLIQSPEQLASLATLVNSYSSAYLSASYRLTQDLDLSAIANWQPIGTENSWFSGCFDGNGFIISGLKIDRTVASYNTYSWGLFGTSDGEISNLGLINSQINIQGVARIYTGGIVGHNLQGYISHCNFDGTLDSYDQSGGIVGYNQGTVKYCYNLGAIDANYYAGGIAGYSLGYIQDCYNQGQIDSLTNAGGIVGHNELDISDCYNLGAITGFNAGGIVGRNFGWYIERCYNLGAIQGQQYQGGIAGIHGKGQIANCYYLNSMAQGTGYGLAPTTQCTAAQLRQADTFTGFDLATVWYMPERQGTPLLRRLDTPLTGLRLKDATLLTGDQADLLEPIPYNASQFDCSWSGFDPQIIAVAADGSVTALRKGVTSLVVKSLQGDFSAACQIRVEQVVTSIDLPSSLQLAPGDHYTLQATVKPGDCLNPALSWSSSNPGIVQVDSAGTIQAIAKGTAQITAAAVDGSGVTAQCAVMVTQPVASVAFISSPASLKVGQTITLNAAVLPADASDPSLIWSSSDPAVAAVSQNGQVCAIARGQVTVTATTVDGGYSAACSITIIQPVTKIELDRSALRLTLGQSDQLTATIWPDNANDLSVIWETDNAQIATVSSTGLVTAINAGTAQVTVRALNGSPTATCTVTINEVVHKIQFRDQDGSELATTYVVNNRLAQAPATPVKADAVFVGWYAEPTYNTLWDFDTDPVTADLTLYARWLKSAMSGVTAQTASYTSIKISWAASEGADLYQIYRATSSSGPFSLLTAVAAPTLAYANTGLTTGKTYYYKICAWANGASSLVSSSDSPIVSARPTPNTPANFKATLAGYDSVKLSWSAVSGATGYRIYQASSSTGTFSLLKTTTAASCTNTSLTTGKTYYYKVCAYHLEGSANVCGSYTAAAKAKPVPAVPSSIAVARYNSSSIKTSWAAVRGASGYQVWRATYSGGTYSLVKTTASTSWINSSLTKGKYYYYKVRAYHLEGTTKVYSAFTAVKYAKPY